MFAQRLALNPLGGNKVTTVAFSYFVDGDDIGMVQRQRRTCFLLKAAYAVVICREVIRQEFQRDLAIRSRVRGKIDLAHSARAEGSDDLVVPDRLSHK